MMFFRGVRSGKLGGEEWAKSGDWGDGWVGG